MSFGATVPAGDFYEFQDSVWEMEVSPRADQRTRKGKLQKALERAAATMLDEAACEVSHADAREDEFFAGSVSGHVNDDGKTGYVSVRLEVLDALPAGRMLC